MTEIGYELFFNRDEQRTRSQALIPKIDTARHAIYPIDPVGKGTWLAVHQSGLSLALLNYYQAEKGQAEKGHAEKGQTEYETLKDIFISRGEIILKLLEKAPDVIEALKAMTLSCYQPFQLCIFAAGLTSKKEKLLCFQWDGVKLTELKQALPITSSGVDYPQVYQAREATFKRMVNTSNPTAKELIDYHYSQQSEGKLSVNMSRIDAKTVSFSHIEIAQNIQFEYRDHHDNQTHLIAF